MDVEILFDDQVFVVAGRRNKWLGRNKVALAELVDEHWLLAPIDNAPGSPVFEIFHALGLEVPRARVLSYSLNVRTSLLATGRFLAIIPASVLRLGAAPSVLQVLPCTLPPSTQPVAVTTLKNRMLSPTAKLFIDSAREVAGTLANRKPRPKG
jgi:DNA-binding transcriptional LysR family regulator